MVTKRVDSGRSGGASDRKPGLRFQWWGCSLKQGVAGTLQARTGLPGHLPAEAARRLWQGSALAGKPLNTLPFGGLLWDLVQSCMAPKEIRQGSGLGQRGPGDRGLSDLSCLCPLAGPLQHRMKLLASCLGLWLLFQLPALVSGTRVVYKVQEEQPPNTLIGSLASDYGFPDVGHLYKLEVGAPYLRVDGKTGDIYTTETSIDRESLRECQYLLPGEPCFLEFEVSITDLILNSSPRLLEGQIEVLDINDNTPNFASPVLTLSIPENTNIGTLFPIPLAMDRDSGPNGVASYELTAGPEAQELFGLQVAEDQDEKQPQLIVMGNLDREQWDSYDLTIKVQDGGNPPRASSALLRITILDMNDNAPKFEKALYEAELSENSPVGHSVLQVSVGAFFSSPAPLLPGCSRDNMGSIYMAACCHSSSREEGAWKGYKPEEPTMPPGANGQAGPWDVTSAKMRLKRRCGEVQPEHGLQDTTGGQQQGWGVSGCKAVGYGRAGTEVHGEAGFMPEQSQCCLQTRHRPFHKLHSLGCSMETQACTGDGGQAAPLLPF